MSSSDEIELTSLRPTTGVFQHDNGQTSAVRRRPVAALGQPPDTHRDLQLTLHSTGAYAVTQNIDARLPEDFDRGEYDKTQHRLFNEVQSKLKWKPWLSGPRGRALQAIVMVVALILHHKLTQYTWENENTHMSQYGPGVLGTVLAMSTRYLCGQELHRVGIQILNTSITSGKQKLVLHLTQMTVVVLVAPMMALPILREADLARTAHLAKGPDYVEWDDVVGNLQRGPFMEPKKSDEGRNFSDFSWSKSFDPRWELRRNGVSNILPGTVLFTAPNKPSDFSPIGPAAEGLGILRPLQSVGEISSNTLIWRRLIPEQRVLSGYLECEMLEVPIEVGIEKNGTMFSVTVPLTDSNDCVAEFTFNSAASNRDERLLLSGLVQGFIADLKRLSEEADTMFSVVQRAKECQKRLEKYRVALEAAQYAIAFQQIWKQATPKSRAKNPAACQRRYMFAGFSDPMAIVDSSGRVSHLQGASCVTHFQEIKVDVDAASPYMAPFRHTDLPPNNAELSYLHIQPHLTDPDASRDEESKGGLVANQPRADPRRIPRNGTFHTRFDEFMLEGLESTTNSKKHPALLDFEYRFLTLSRFETGSYHSIALGGKLLISTMHQIIADAASVTLLENPSSGGWWLYPRDDGSFLQNRTLQAEWWFRTIFHGSITVSLLLILLSHCFADDGPSGLPWDVSSIAARAALLYRSNLPRAFRDNEYGPEGINQLRPLRIGYFGVDGDHATQNWKMDSLLNQCVLSMPGKPNVNYRRHNTRSLPGSACFSTISVVTLLLLAIPGMIWAMLNNIRGSIRHQPVSKYFKISPLFLGLQTGRPTSFTEAVSLRLLPAISTMLLAHFWVTSLVHFYKTRLPWVGLAEYLPSQKSLTLDYTNSWLPLAKAIKNQHWVLFFMIISASVLIPLPIVVMNLYHYEGFVQDIETTLVPRHYVWNFQDLGRNEDNSVTHVLQQVLQSIPNSTALPKWSSYREAILPIDLLSVDETELPHDLAYNEVGYWEVESEAVRAELECERLPLWFHRDASALPFANTSNGMVVVDPCFNGLDENHSKTSTTCSHWQPIKLSGTNSEVKESLAWVISAAKVIKGTISLPEALLCHPRFYTNSGTVQLVSLDGQLRNAHIHNFSSSTEETMISGELGWHFNRLINESVFEPTSASLRQVGVQLASPRISTAKFRGDILSFMAYIWATQADKNLSDDGVLASVANKVFSTIFATAVPHLGLFETPTAGLKVSVIQKTWIEDIKFHRSFILASFAYLLLLFFVLGLHATTMLQKNKYLFPFSPEPLENSLFFLYRSDLIDYLGQRIPQPETLSMEQFYRRVDGLFLRCSFGLLNPEDAWTKATIIVHSNSTEGSNSTEPFADASGDEVPLLEGFAID